MESMMDHYCWWHSQQVSVPAEPFRPYDTNDVWFIRSFVFATHFLLLAHKFSARSSSSDFLPNLKHFN